MKSHVILGVLVAIAFGATLWLSSPRGTPHQEALFYESDFTSVPEGTLIRGEGGQEVYYAADGKKRWIDSAETFAAQGFRSEEVVTLTNAELARYPDGEPITAATALVLPRERKVLPDLAPLAPYDLRLSTVAGRTVVRFTGSFWNKGYRPFTILTDNHVTGGPEGTEDVSQYVEAEDGTFRRKYIGTFVWHPEHNHHHYKEFAEYLLEPANVVPGTKIFGPSIRQKTTFCIRDDERMPADIPNVPLRAVSTTCGKERQSVSPGWIDVYSHTLPDQYVDVHDLQPGIYALSFLVDPNRRFIEESGDNNIATTLIELDPRRRHLRIIGSFSPFQTLRNRVTDGTLIRDSDSGRTYVIERGRKRWLRTEGVLMSYGYPWSAVYPVTKAMADAIEPQRLIRRQGTSEVYVLNEHGTFRHLLNAAVFASYGFTADDVADINDTDFATYTEGRLIVLPGDTEVYEVSGATKHRAGSLDELQADGADLSGLHIVNQTDFDAYTLN